MLPCSKPFRIQAHTIKGASANIAAMRLRETAAAMEAQARKKDLSNAVVLMTRLQEEFDQFLRECGNIRSSGLKKG